MQKGSLFSYSLLTPHSSLLTTHSLLTVFRFLLFILFLITQISFSQVKEFREVFFPEIRQELIGNKYQTVIKAELEENYYLYKDKLKIENQDLINPEISFSNSTEKTDPFFGKSEIYDFNYPLEIKITHNNQVDIFELSLQACLENVICFPPEKFLISVSLGGKFENNLKRKNNLLLNNSPPNINQVKNNNLESNLNNNLENKLEENYFKSLFLVFILGLGISFSACSYPLIPIVSSLVIGKSKGKRAYLLLATYVLAMGVAMGILGAVFGIFNNFNLQAALQKPIFLIPTALVFFLLSLALFEVFNLQMPSFLQNFSNKIAQRQKSGEFLGAGILGFISILIVSPCASPVLTALLLYCTQRGIFWGFWALFIFGLGNGLPLFLFAGILKKFMPKSGQWLNIIKKVYAFLMLFIAFYIFSRLLDNYLFWSLWLIYFSFLALYFRKNLYILFLGFLIANFCLIQSSLHYYNFNNQNIIKTETLFKTISISELEQEIKNSDKKVILDFYADWCVECKFNERDFFNNPNYFSVLRNFKLLKIDVSNYGEKEKNLFQKLGLVAPPATLIYPAWGDYLKPEEKIIGALKNHNFLELLAK